MENNYEDRLLDTFSRMLEILEKYSDYGGDKKFVEDKRNSESEIARKDAVQEEIERADSEDQEEIKVEHLEEQDEVEVEHESEESIKGEAKIDLEDVAEDFCVVAGIMEEQKTCVINFGSPIRMLALIPGPTEEKFRNDYTWEKFFQNNFASDAKRWDQLGWK